MTPIGFKIYYSASTVIGSLPTDWTLAPGTDVQVIVVYFAETYQIWKCEWDGQGQQVNGRWETENYVEQFHSSDYYWLDPTTQTYGQGTANEVPQGAISKRGSAISNADWWVVYNTVMEDRKWVS